VCVFFLFSVLTINILDLCLRPTLKYLLKKNMRILLTLLLLMFFTNSHSQIKIDDVGDGWKMKVDSALKLIQRVDPDKYDIVTDVCNHITYWNGGFSTTEDETTIMITQKDMMSSINNIAAIIVHESKHLFLLKINTRLTPSDEELLCYRYELDFLGKIPNVEVWLIDNAKKRIKYYSGLD